MKGLLQWLIDPKGGTPLVGLLAGALGSVLTTVLHVPQTAVDGCLLVLRAVAPGLGLSN